MSRITTEEQLNFLLSCVRNSNNGKVNFEAVAQECEIISKGAAAKRYERLMKANGINPNGGGPANPADGGPTTTENTTPKKPRKAPASKATTPKEPKSTTSTPRKRKGGQAATAIDSPTKKYKSAEKIKEEDSDEDDAVNGNSVNVDDKAKTKGKGQKNGEGGLRSENDPFLGTAAAKGNDEADACLQAFMNTAKSAAEKQNDDANDNDIEEDTEDLA
ncbi:hypothetical protein PRK78_001822 [Emydomyces testavorans]|uniref:Myb-like DNA-binding domain-containing protein n=1 Tax=Emydomyces testavorans TaxID=2070801 RepID=A0AAF0DD84_9EURO|nr:hypothetical protein PRK78_001822 [Emydomyces testavorans]